MKISWRKVFWGVLLLILLGLFYFLLGYPIEYRAGDWREFLGQGPAEGPMYRVARLVEEKPVRKEVPFLEPVMSALEEEGNLSRNSPYPMSLTLGESKFRLMNRPVLIAPAPATLVYEVKVPPGARLEFGYARKERLGKKRQPGVRFVVEWHGEKGNARLFEDRIENSPPGFWEKKKKRAEIWRRYLHPRFSPWGENFREARVDLSRFAGQEGELWFITERLEPTAGEEFSAAVWANPEIWARGGEGKPPPVNLLLFVIEATPVSMVQPYSENPGVTPNIKKFAERAVVFDKYFTVGDSTQLSTFSMFTGRHYRAMGLPNEMYFLAPMVKARFYQERYATLPEAFEKSGYKTALIGSNIFFVPTRQIGLDLGFQEVDAMNRRYYTSTDTLLAVMAWLRKNHSKPFCLYVHYDAPHEEEKPCLEDLLRSLTVMTKDWRWTYRKNLAQVMNADTALGRILTALSELGVDQRTLVVVTADHGNCVDPAHDFAVIRPGHKPWWTPFQHGRSLLAEDIHVPLLINWPLPNTEGVKQGRRFSCPAASVDLFPTLVDLLLPELPPDFKPRMKNLDGKSLAPLLKGESVGSGENAGHAVIYSLSAGGESIVMAGRYHYFRRAPGYEKLLRGGEAQLRVVKEGLFDLDLDPRELHDLASSQPELLSHMRQALNQVRPRETLLRFLYFNYTSGKVQARLSLSGAPSLLMTFPQERTPLTLEEWKHGGGKEETEGTIYQIETELKGPTGILLDQDVKWMEISWQGSPVSTQETRLGPFGLPFLNHSGCSWLSASPFQENIFAEKVLLEDCFWLSPSVLLSRHHPLRYLDRPGVYFYTMSFSDFVEETFSDQQLSPALHSALKQWGYIE